MTSVTIDNLPSARQYKLMLFLEGTNINLDSVRMMIGLFLFEKKMETKISLKSEIENRYKFYPGIYGAISDEVTQDLGWLKQNGYVGVEHRPNQLWDYCYLTQKAYEFLPAAEFILKCNFKWTIYSYLQTMKRFV